MANQMLSFEERLNAHPQLRAHLTQLMTQICCKNGTSQHHVYIMVVKNSKFYATCVR